VGKKPALRDPGKTALNSLLAAVDQVNVAVKAGGQVTEHFTDLMRSVAEAADNFAAKEADATNVQLVTRSGKIYTRDKKVETREKLTVQFDHDSGTGPAHYVLP
jgi:phage gpG-like protein